MTLLRTGEHTCPYLAGRVASNEVVLSPEVDTGLYQDLMDAGFRRTGLMFYRPNCPTCRACLPIRVVADKFVPSRSQRRVQRRNTDITMETGLPSCDDEHYELYLRYQQAKHARPGAGSREDFEQSLCESSIHTMEMSYRLDGCLIGVGIVDVCPRSLSSVYFYYDPAHARRSLGTWSGMCEIEECRRRGLPHWYAGYHIEGCAKMEYKSRFRPYELMLCGRWTPVPVRPS